MASYCFHFSLQTFRKLQSLGLNEEHENSLMVGSSILSNIYQALSSEERAWERGYILPNRQWVSVSVLEPLSQAVTRLPVVRAIVGGSEFNFYLMPNEIVSYVTKSESENKPGYIHHGNVYVISQWHHSHFLGSEGPRSETAWEQAAVSYYIFCTSLRSV